MKKVLTTLTFLFFNVVTLLAQPDLSSPGNTFLNNTLKPLAPIVFVVAFLMGAIYNIGEIWGDQKNWKAFFTKVGLFIGAVLVTVVIVGYLSTISL